MTQFKLTRDPNLVLRVGDNTSIPRGHRWWREYEAWLAEGNTPLPADPPPPTPPDLDATLDLAIDGAANFAALKAVLKGRVKARPV